MQYVGSEVIIGDRVLGSISKLKCGESSFDPVDYYRELEDLLNQLNSVKDDFDEIKVVLISFCEAPDDNNSCNIIESSNGDNEIEINVLNIGSSISENEFLCLLNGVSQRSKYAQYDSFDQTNDDIERVAEEIGEKPTPNTNTYSNTVSNS